MLQKRWLLRSSQPLKNHRCCSGVYQRNLARAFSRTVEERRFHFVIIDAPNLRVSDFQEMLAFGQQSGFEVYILQAPETDPQVL